LLEKEFYQNSATSLLVTSKDLVKLQDCKLPLSVLDLKLEIDPKILERIDRYILSYPCNTKEHL
ncbi:tetraacyldisaccharide 4'-kinase, partial [Helicobacter pylori]